MAKYRLKKDVPKKIIKLLVFSFMIAATIYFWVNINREIQLTMTLRASVAESEEQLRKLEEEKQQLVEKKEKLTDTNYVSSIARGEYLITKEGEQVFVLPALKD